MIGDRVIAGDRRRHGVVVSFMPNKNYVKVRADVDGILREYSVKTLVAEPIPETVEPK